jgi:SHS2 domain-containing protein
MKDAPEARGADPGPHDARGSGPAWEYFDHDADVGVVGRGARPEDAFVAAARATFALMTEPGGIERRARIEVGFEEADLELALVRWLNLLLAHAHDRGLALGEFELTRDGDAWRGRAWGEPWREGLERGTDVKGATLTALSVRRAGDGWEARCVVDV